MYQQMQSHEQRASFALKASVAFVWLATGFLVVHPYYREVGNRYLSQLGVGDWLMWLTCVFEVLLGSLVLLRPAYTWLIVLQISMVATFTVILGVLEPMLLVHPFGVLTKNLPLIGALGASWLFEREGMSKRAIWVLRFAMAIVWITEGLLPKILFQQELELAIAREHPLVFIDASLFLALLGVAQVASGVLALLLRGKLLRLLLWAQVIALVALPILTAYDNIEMWVHPFGPLTKVVPIVVGTAVLALYGVQQEPASEA